MEKVRDLLFKNMDLEYKEFTSLLIPNVSKDSIIGVRVPVIRKLIKELNRNDKKKFMNELPHKYLEEYYLHAFLISDCKNIDECISLLENFLPYVNNWAICDSLSCKILSSDLDKTFNYLLKCISSNETYKIRFAFVMMLKYFINDEYIKRCNEVAMNTQSSEYYVNMAIAWYFSCALAEEYDETIKLFENNLLSRWIHNKSIQKAIESNRISENIKNYLKDLRI